MKKTLLITFAATLLVLLIGVWIYLFLFGTPQQGSDIFARFGDNTEGTIEDIPVIETDTDPTTPFAPSRFRQLTSRPVAGAGFRGNTIQYVEQGTGHIYEIDLATGDSIILSGTTIPFTTHAVFSATGTSVAITSIQNNEASTMVSIMGTSTSMEGTLLPVGAREISFNADGTIAYYLLEYPEGARGYAYDLSKKTATELFNIPLRDVRVVWGSPIYVYTTPTITQEGNVYTISGRNGLAYAAGGAPGLVAVRYEKGIVTSSVTENNPQYTAVASNGTRIDQAVPFIPEKCALDPLDGALVLCAVPLNLNEGAFPDEWYMGKIAYSDTLWEMNVGAGDALSLLDLQQESGRPMDIRSIGMDTYGLRVYLINKNDNTLWLFDRSIE